MRSIFLRVGSLADRLAEPVSWLGAVIAFLVLLYLLAAPPIVLAHVKQTGSGSFPSVYGPVLRLIESDFGGPMVWYFNNVWGAELALIGGDEGPPWYSIATYIALGGALLGALALPFLKAWRQRAPNKAHSVDAPIARLFHLRHHFRRATDAHRWGRI
jgi:hypothetical protein